MASHSRQARTLYAVVWITVSIGITLMGTGLLGSLIGIRAEREGIGAGVMGVAMAMYYVGFVSGMPIMNRVLELLSRRRMFAVCTFGMGAAAFGYGLVVNPVAWLGLRYATGFLLAGCYLVVETWLNDLAHNDVRGKVMGLYVAVVAAGLVAGQIVLAFTEPSSWISFAIAGAITAVAFAPMVLVTKGAGVRHCREGGMSLREVAIAVPSGVVGFVLVGVTQGCVLTMSSVYAARAGLSAGQVGIRRFDHRRRGRVPDPRRRARRSDLATARDDGPVRGHDRDLRRHADRDTGLDACLCPRVCARRVQHTALRAGELVHP